MNLLSLPKLSFLDKLRKPHPPKGFLTAEVTPEVAKALRFSLNPEGFVELLSIGKYPLSDPAAVLFGNILKPAVVEEALMFAIKRALATAITPVNAIIFGAYGNASKCFSTAARRRRENPEEKVSEKETMAVVEKIEEAAFARALGIASFEFGDPKVDLDLTNSAIVSTTVDEALVSQESGFPGERVEINLFTAFSPVKFLETASSICKHLSLNRIITSSETYSVIQSISPTRNVDFNVILVNIHHDVTDVSVIFGSGPKESLSFGIGSRSFQEDEEGINFWLSSLDVVLGEFEGVKTFPNEFLLLGEGAKFLEVSSRLFDYPWVKKHPFRLSPEVKTASFDSFQKVKVPVDLALIEDMGAISLGIVGLEVYA